MKSFIITLILCFGVVFAISGASKKYQQESAAPEPVRFKRISTETHGMLRLDVYEDTLTKRTYLVSKEYYAGGVTLMP